MTRQTKPHEVFRYSAVKWNILFFKSTYFVCSSRLAPSGLFLNTRRRIIAVNQFITHVFIPKRNICAINCLMLEPPPLMLCGVLHNFWKLVITLRNISKRISHLYLIIDARDDELVLRIYQQLGYDENKNQYITFPLSWIYFQLLSDRTCSCVQFNLTTCTRLSSELHGTRGKKKKKV